MVDPSPSALLQLQDLSITYPRGSQPAVTEVSLALYPGEIVGLVGESGCGKSTLGRAMLRLLPPGSRVSGRLDFEGQSVLDLPPKGLQRFRGEAVGLVFQDPMTRLDPLMTIGDHCYETLKVHRPQLSKRQILDRIGEALDAVHIARDRAQQYPHEFSGGMRQRVAIALTLMLNPKLIVADEPTTSLDVTVAAQILTELTRLCRERSMAMMLISHDLALVGQYCDRIAVMYDGAMVENGETQQVLYHPRHPYTQTLLRAAMQLHGDHPYPEEPQGSHGTIEGKIEGTTDPEATPQLAPALDQATDLNSAANPDRNGLSPHHHQGNPDRNGQPLHPATPDSAAATPAPQPLLRLSQVRQYYTLDSGILGRFLGQSPNTIKAVDDLSFEVMAGETLGLVGESGCGKSTLCRTILQLIKPTAGRIEFGDQDLCQMSAPVLRRQRRSMQMVFQDPRACLNPLMTLGQSIADPLLVHRLVPHAAAAKTQVLALLERVGLTPADTFYHRRPHEISGGQQQRVAIARALITHPQLLICDEPVSMLDATVQAQVLELMVDLKREFQLTYIFVTHDLWVARSFCDRIAVMSGGKIVELGTTDQVFRHPQHPYTRSLLAAAPVLRTA